MKSDVAKVADVKSAPRTVVETKQRVAATPRRVLVLRGIAIVLGLLILNSLWQRQRAAALARSEAATCYAHLQEISAALMKYRQDHGGKLPRFLSEAPPSMTADDSLYPKYIKSKDVFVCPGAVRFQHELEAKAGMSNSPEPEQTYNYVAQVWLQDNPGRVINRDVFYNEVLPQHKDEVRLVQCGYHPGGGDVWAIMWDGSIKTVPFLFDNYYGWGKRDPAIRRMDERIRKKGGILPPGV